ncbi:MAG: radical SAM protein [Bacilli bacterium]|nr:radical SAM protein [Bacilli bacterium]
MRRTRIASGGIEITDYCNLKCMHCYIGEIENPIHMELDNIIYLIDVLIKYQAEYIVISGGEPFMHPFIDDIIDIIGTNYQNIPFIITTNGSFLDKKHLDQIIKYENIQIQISLDGVTKEVHEQQHGENTFDKIIEVLEYLKCVKRRRKILRMTVSKVNYKECVKFAELADYFNMDTSFAYVTKVGRANENWDNLKMSLAQQIYVNEEIRKYAEKSNIDIIPPQSVLNCPFESFEHIFSVTIHTNGDVDICTCLDGKYIVGNAFKNDFCNIINSNTIDLLTTKILQRKNQLKFTECKDCIINFRCQQGCIGRATYLGDEFGLDDQCDYRRALMFKNYYIRFNNKRGNI